MGIVSFRREGNIRNRHGLEATDEFILDAVSCVRVVGCGDDRGSDTVGMDEVAMTSHCSGIGVYPDFDLCIVYTC